MAAAADNLELRKLAAEEALIRGMRMLIREIRRMRKRDRELHDDDDDLED